MLKGFKAVFFVFTLFWVNPSWSQTLKPGFDPQEYLQILRISGRLSSDTNRTKLASPDKYVKRYSSTETPFLNKFEIWTDTLNKIAVLSFRGTVKDSKSWAENFYSTMYPTIGKLNLENKDFLYQLSEDTSAKVHLGWLVALADLSTDFTGQINQLEKLGYSNLIITGHSQGGAIAFLARAYLHYSPNFDENKWNIKTYCTAPPKPGNQFFAYDFESYNYGWVYRIVNPLDWVPDMPFTIQGSNEINTPNPFYQLKTTLKTQSFATRIGGNYLYKKLNNGLRKAQKRFYKYDFKLTYRYLSNFRPATPTSPKNYQQYYFPCGNAIILKPTPNYYKWSNEQKKDIFLHHMKTPYELLLIENYPILKK